MTAAERPRLMALAPPLLAELGLGIAVGFAGTIMAARVSDTSGAAFAMGNQVFQLLFLLFRVIGAGVAVVVSQALGGGRRDEAEALARATLGASSWIGLTIACCALAGADALMRLLNAPAEVLPLAAPFLRWLAPAMLLDAWNASMASVMRAHLRVRDVLAVIVTMHLVHLVAALLLMPRVGLPGFAWALLASRAIGVALHLLLWRWRLGLVPRMADGWRLPRREVGTVLRIGLPAAAENIAWRFAFVFSLSVVGQLGTTALATHAYTMQVVHCILIISAATGLAVEIVVGRLIGAGRLHQAHRLVKRALAGGLAASVGVATLAALAGPWLLGLFTQDPAVVAAGATLLWWTVLLEPGRAFNLIVINALRATGDARFPVAAGAAFMLLVLAGGSWLLGLAAGLGLVGVWIAYIADEWLRGLIMWRRWVTHGWVRHARATRKRLRRAAAS